MSLINTLDAYFFVIMHTQVDSSLTVSPGYMPEKDFVETITSADAHYLLPQYASAFLLAKDIKMEFKGTSTSVTRTALQESASATLSGSYGPFSASASFGYGHQHTNLQCGSTTTGMVIKIPGAQIIGYYAQVVPKFPASQ